MAAADVPSTPKAGEYTSASSNSGSHPAEQDLEDELIEQRKGICGIKRTPREYWRQLTTNWPPKFIAYLAFVYFFVKGLAFQAATAAQLPLYKDQFNVDAVDYQRFGNVANMGFALKPLVGALSDVIPIRGFRKRYYAAGFSLFATVSVVLATFLPNKPSSGAIAAVFFFLMVWGVAALDLLCEGKYSELMVKLPKHGSSIVTWAYGCYMLGAVIAACIEGPMADYVNVRVVLWIAAPMLFAPCIPSLLGWIPEGKMKEGKEQAWESGAADGSLVARVVDPRDDLTTAVDAESEPVNGFSWKPKALKYWSHQQKSIVVCGLCNAWAALCLAIITLITKNEYVTLTYIVLVIAALLTACYMFLPRAAFKANAFFVGHSILYINISGLLDYWYTAKPNCVPDGPHFSYSYYQTFAGIAGNVSGFLGVFVFEAWLNKWTFRRVFYLTTALKITASIFDLIMVYRWNVRVGIPDEVAYMMGDKIIFPVVQMLDFMPGVILMAKVCPKGVESTMYALLAGFSNFGFTVSTTIGYLMADAFKIAHSENGGCNFDNLPGLIIVTHGLLPLLIIPLATFMLPNVSMKNNVDAKGRDHNGRATEGEDGGAAVSLVDNWADGHVGGKEIATITYGAEGSDARRSSARRRTTGVHEDGTELRNEVRVDQM